MLATGVLAGKTLSVRHCLYQPLTGHHIARSTNILGFREIEPTLNSKMPFVLGLASEAITYHRFAP